LTSVLLNLDVKREKMIDLHTHSAISDGTDTVPELIGKAEAQGITVLSLTDHDTMAGVNEAKVYGVGAGVEVLRGMEMSTHIVVDGANKPVHLLAYGARPDDRDLTSMLEAVLEARRTRVPAMLELLAGMGMPLDIEDVEAQSVRASSTGRPHIADAMVAKGYVTSRDEAFKRYLYDSGPAYVHRYTPSLNEAVGLVTRAGAVPVIAHPWGRGNRPMVTPEIMADAKSYGLFGIEADHIDHTPQERRLLHEVADDLGLVATGSSDYHGTGKTRNPLGVCTTPPDVYEKIKTEIEERGGQL